MRNTARRLGSGKSQNAADRLHVDLRAYRRGEVIYSDTQFGHITQGGTLVVREADLVLPKDGDARPEDEVLLVARVHKDGGDEPFFSQEHQLVYTHAASRAQAYLLYDQQPVRSPTAPVAPIVFLMPKIWLSEEINTYVVVSNTWDVEAPTLQREPVRFALLDERGVEVSAWEHCFFYNEAKVFDLRQRVDGLVAGKPEPRFFNLVGRGGASSFVLFAIVRNVKSNHFAVEHSLPPIYYMDGAMGPVRAQGCDVTLFEHGATR